MGSPANLFLFDFIHETSPTTFTANNCVMYRTFTGSDTIKTTLQALDAYIHLSCCTPSSPMRHHCQSEDTWGGTDPKTLTASDPENRGRTVYTRLLLHIFTSLALISPVLRSIPNIWHGIGNVWSAAVLFHNITTNHNPADVVFTLHHQRPVATSEQAQWGVFAGFTPEYIKKKICLHLFWALHMQGYYPSAPGKLLSVAARRRAEQQYLQTCWWSVAVVVKRVLAARLASLTFFSLYCHCQGQSGDADVGCLLPTAPRAVCPNMLYHLFLVCVLFCVC